jgi:putative tryptophan/tyrosine transport system substrate-binding protein
VISRRAFVGALGLGALTAPVRAEAQRAARLSRIAFLGAEAPSTSQQFLAAFREGLRARGHVEGRDILVEASWAEGRGDRFPDLVAEILRLKADVILVMSTPAALAAKKATATIPIVFVAADPLGTGLVPSLSRPGENITGVSLSLGVEFTGKWLELLREVVPRASHVAVLWNPANPSNVAYLKALEAAAPQLRMKLKPEGIRDPGDLDRVFGAIGDGQVQALVVLTDPLTVRYQSPIVERAAERRLPTMYGFREFVDAGGLMSYGVSVPEMCRRAAGYVDKILKGAKPGDLPVEQPTAFELVINLKTAKALGLAMPQSLLQRADHVLQ